MNFRTASRWLFFLAAATFLALGLRGFAAYYIWMGTPDSLREITWFAAFWTASGAVVAFLLSLSRRP